MKKILRNEKGFAVSMIILVIALFAIIIAAMAIAGRGTNVTGSEQTAKVHASTIIQQGNNLKTGFDYMISNKAIDISTITFNADDNTGLFHPTDGGVPQQFPPKEALKTTDNDWVYKRNNNGNAVVKLKGVGTDAGEDYVVALVDIKKSVCEQINKALYGSTYIPPTTAGSSTATNWNTAATEINLSYETNDKIKQKPELCIKTTNENKYVYYKAVYEQ